MYMITSKFCDLPHTIKTLCSLQSHLRNGHFLKMFSKIYFYLCVSTSVWRVCATASRQKKALDPLEQEVLLIT